MTINCGECGRDLSVNPVEKPNTDWIKLVCSDCGNVEEVSMIRLAAATSKRE